MLHEGVSEHRFGTDLHPILCWDLAELAVGWMKKPQTCTNRHWPQEHMGQRSHVRASTYVKNNPVINMERLETSV